MSIYEVTKLGFNQYVKLLEKRAQAVVVVNDKGKIVAANENWAKIVGNETAAELMDSRTPLTDFLPKYQPSGNQSDDVVQDSIKKCHSRKEVPKVLSFLKGEDDQVLCNMSILPIKILKKKCAEFVIMSVEGGDADGKKEEEVIEEEISDENGTSSGESESAGAVESDEEVVSESLDEVNSEEGSEAESLSESPPRKEEPVTNDTIEKKKEEPSKPKLTEPEKAALKEKEEKEELQKAKEMENERLKAVLEQGKLREEDSKVLRVHLNDFDRAIDSIRQHVQSLEGKVQADINKLLKESSELHEVILSSQMHTLQQMRERLLSEKRNHSMKTQSLEAHLKRRLSSLESEKLAKEDLQIENKKLRKLLKDLRSSINESLDTVSDLM